MIVIKCPYCNSFIEDKTNNNFQDKEDFDNVLCFSCRKKVCLEKIEVAGQSDHGFSEDFYDYQGIKAPCLNGDKDNHLIRGDHCIICKEDVIPVCMKVGNFHKFDDVSHLCVYCNNCLDPLFVPCKNGGKMHQFVSGQCHCLKLENCTEKDILEAQAKSLEFKKVIGTLGQTMNFKSPEYKGLVGGLINQIKKIDKFLEANR